MAMHSRFGTRTLVMMALLTAMEIVLSRFLSFSAWNMKIGFAFVPLAAAAILFGPAEAAVVGGLSDLLGALLVPVGPYFPGFTLTAACMGAVLGLLLHKKQSLARVCCAVGFTLLVLSLLVNSLWISILYGSPYGGIVAARLVQCAILAPVQVCVIGAMARVFQPMLRRAAAQG